MRIFGLIFGRDESTGSASPCTMSSSETCRRGCVLLEEEVDTRRDAPRRNSGDGFRQSADRLRRRFCLRKTFGMLPATLGNNRDSHVSQYDKIRSKFRAKMQKVSELGSFVPRKSRDGLASRSDASLRHSLGHSYKYKSV